MCCFTAVANIAEIGDLLVAALATIWEITQFRVSDSSLCESLVDET